MKPVEELFDIQLVKKTFFPSTQYEATGCLDYTTLSGKSGYCITLPDTKGVQTKYYTDCLQSVCRVEEPMSVELPKAILSSHHPFMDLVTLTYREDVNG